MAGVLRRLALTTHASASTQWSAASCEQLVARLASAGQASPGSAFATSPARAFKFYTPHFTEVVPEACDDEQDVAENGRLASETSDLILEATIQARHREKWREHSHHIKRKYQRQNHRWAGVVRRNRHDFNYRLRWALKCMSRGL